MKLFLEKREREPTCALTKFDPHPLFAQRKNGLRADPQSMLQSTGRKFSYCGCIRRRSPSCFLSPCRAQTLASPRISTSLNVESSNPSDLISMAGDVKDKCMQLQWAFDDLLLSLPPLSSDNQQAHIHRIQHLTIMTRAVECLMQVRLLTSNE